MADPELTHQYAPNAALQAIYRRVFENIQVEEGWAEQMRALSARGSVLYVLPNLNWLDFIALDYLTKRHGLPPIRYANDLGLWLLNPQGPNVKGKGLWNMLLPTRRENPEEQLREAIDHGASAALFLKRPPSVMDVASGATGGRGMREGDELVRALFRMQREGDRPLLLIPLVFVWSKSPDRIGVRPWDFVLGPHAWPTPTRALGQFAYNMKHASLRWGDPIDVGEELDRNPELSDAVLVRRVTYMVLRRIERERRAVTGPAQKDPERVRQEILRSPRLQSVIEDVAAKDNGDVGERLAEAAEMLEELQARPNANVLKGMGVGLRWGFNRIYRGIEYNQQDIDRIRDASRDGTMILLPSHKSHIDYLVLSYFFYERNLPLPVIAAGDNLNFQPVGPIFRRCGAFFIRRSFKGDRLYAAVVDAYVRRLIRDGYPIELFLEGGRSRTGKLLEPKFGLLNMIVDAALGVPTQKVHFLPVSIGYERVVEADSYQRELSGAEKKKEEAADLLSASDVLRHRYGRINLQFGQTMTLDDICGDLGIQAELMRRPAKRRAVVTRLGNRVMDEINRVTAVTPGALTALAILADNRRAVSESTVIRDSEHLVRVLTRAGARVTTPTLLPNGSIRGPSIREALQLFVDAQLLDHAEPAVGGDEKSGRGDPVYAVVESRRLQLDTSKNIIVHFFVERGLVACAFDRDANGVMVPTKVEHLKRRVLWASRLFKHEFRFRADASFDDIFETTCNQLIAEGHLARQEGNLGAGPGEGDWSGADWMRIYRGILAAFFEGYYIAGRSLDELLLGAKSDKELIKKALSLGNELYLREEVVRREAISKPVLSNAYLAFAELGFLRSSGGKLELKEMFDFREALDELQRTIFGFISGQHAQGQLGTHRTSDPALLPEASDEAES